MSIDRVIALDELYQSYVGFTKIPTYGTNRRCKTCHQPINPYRKGKYCFCHYNVDFEKKIKAQEDNARIRKMLASRRRYDKIRKSLTKV